MQPQSLWRVVPPPRRSRIPGVTMAGFCASNKVDHALLPHPDVTLVFDFGPSSPIVADCTGRHRGSLVAPVGYGRSASIRGGTMACVQVRLSPLVAPAILGVSLAELDGVIELGDVWGQDVTGSHAEQLSDARGWAHRFDLVERVLINRLVDASRPDPEISWVWSRMTSSGGRIQVDHLARELGWSRKRLWYRFGQQVGLPPKRAATLLRFDRAVHYLLAGLHAADVAVATGYADQSHLNRDVVALAGVTPAEVVREPFLTVDREAWPATMPQQTGRDFAVSTAGSGVQYRGRGVR